MLKGLQHPNIVRFYDYWEVNKQAAKIGMISHKMSLITIFGHKHFRQKFLQKFAIFWETRLKIGFSFPNRMHIK